MKIFIFGIGQFYQANKKTLNKILLNDDMCGFIDNRTDKIIYFEDFPVYNPRMLLSLDFDVVILMSASAYEMRIQLLELGVPEVKIFYWEEYVSIKSRGKLRFYTKNKELNGKKKILLISTNLDYNGASIALVHAARCLTVKGYAVCIAAPWGNDNFISEMVEKNLNFIIANSLPYVYPEELFWISQFDIVLVNTFQMIQCVCEIVKSKPVIWWIHEPSEKYCRIYPNTQQRFIKYGNIERFIGVNIFAVSKIAQKNFEKYYFGRINGILHYGIPDEMKTQKHTHNLQEKLVFAIIGALDERKAQKIFMNAVKFLSVINYNDVEFWLIGAYENNAELVQMGKVIPRVKFIGLLSREQISQIFPCIDVVVCPSLEDPMPIVVTEGMMYSKVCIISEDVGQVQYINDGENGFICKTGDVKSLVEKMMWCIDNRDKLDIMGKRARRIYEENFSTEKFGERLEQLLLETERKYEQSLLGGRK